MNWLWENLGQVWGLTLDHAALSVAPLVGGFVLSLPLGWLAHRFHFPRKILLGGAGLLYAIPSLPLLVALPTLLGTKILNPVNLVVALTLYAVALLVRITSDALASVDDEVTRAATAVGFSAWRRFWSVELPLAGPVLLAGLRVVSVSTVSLVTIGSVVGVNTLGYLFLNGLQRDFPTEIIVGIIATVVVALVFDGFLVGAGRLLLPWATIDRGSRRDARRTAAAAVSAS